ncbi:hypothetical protein HOU02_gp222 [Caulobacter phage CcrBL9]|uniref:Uncharacterized protein n=1 Tax=Caulobacter phage CcrBL9 TaxID=2283270 RepID=A0A385ECK0_9CAUD|nr:hypothetical protein HOU02_gp222 [Caulobacter phage CcrBL9]AXQ69503.1 hypothetical protein CcrBL9_gp479 [Caulobacter phage CcrBL9]
MKLGPNDMFVIRDIMGGVAVAFRTESVSGNQSCSLDIARFAFATYPTIGAAQDAAQALRNKLNEALVSERLASLVLTTPKWDPDLVYITGDQVAYKGEVFEYCSAEPTRPGSARPDWSSRWENVKHIGRLNHRRAELVRQAAQAKA